MEWAKLQSQDIALRIQIRFSIIMGSLWKWVSASCWCPKRCCFRQECFDSLQALG
jgi:hypothetical protein